MERQNLWLLLREQVEKGAVRLDPFSGLPEGLVFFDIAQRRLGTLGPGWCVLAADIRHFKLFCSWNGLAASQRLLKQVAAALAREAEAVGGLPGFLGQDQFALLAPYDEGRVKALYERLRAILADAGTIQGFIPLFGLAPVNGSRDHIMEYYNDAALTVEDTKKDPTTHIRLYDPEHFRRSAREYKLLYDFQEAMAQGEITFWLQPQCRVSTRGVVGAEALARWRRPDGSMVSPADFIPILEKYGLITQLDVHLWEEVCRWLRSWLDRGMTPVPVSVNVSRIDIAGMDVPACFGELIRRYELPPKLIKIEVTESAYMDNAGAVEDTVTRLRAQGFLVLMDDFGSGYSSLNMLRSLPVDVIKLDAQFLRIRDEEEQKGVSILESIVNMTRNLATPIIVEGVETEAQMRFLVGLGCRYMQGFYFYRPMPVGDFETLISRQGRIDSHGFVFKSNQQLHSREFLDENIYSDAMLNNILGPVAFYYWHGEDVDILRYNEQFYQLVGIEAEEMEARKQQIQRFLMAGDREKFIRLLEEAAAHHANGSRGIVRFFRPNGTVVWVSLKLYLIGEDARGKTFYASAQDVTELQFISNDLPGAYFRSSLEDGFELYFASQNFLKMTGYTREELKQEFGNRLLPMVHPDDAPALEENCLALRRGEIDQLPPYRLRRKQGDYIHVAEQCQITDHFGPPCWQSVIIDVTQVAHIEAQMRVLNHYFSDSILFLHRMEDHLEYEVAVHGLAPLLGMDAARFQEALNAGEICPFIEGYAGLPHHEYTRLFVEKLAGGTEELTLHLPGGKTLRLRARADRVDDRSSIAYIVILHAIEGV